jgi:hypothetical protein
VTVGVTVSGSGPHRHRWTRRTRSDPPASRWVGPAPVSRRVGAGQLHRRRGLDALDGGEGQLLLTGDQRWSSLDVVGRSGLRRDGLHIDHDRLADPEFLPQDPLRQRVLDHLLDGPAQRPCPELGVVPLVGEQLLGRWGEHQAQPLQLELVGDPLDHQIHDLDHLDLGQLVEHHDLVDAVEELGTEVGLQRLVDLGLHALVGDRLRRLGETDRRLAKIGGPEVGRHDEDGVLEVHRTTLGVGQATVLQDLEQRVEHVGVGLLDLVEQHHGERLAADRFGQLATLFVPDVAGG